MFNFRVQQPLQFRSFFIRDKRQPDISLWEYINAVVSRIVIGLLDLKQFFDKI